MNKIPLFFIFLLFTSCTKELKINTLVLEKKLVVQSFFSSEKEWNIYVGHTHIQGTNMGDSVTDARVEIYANGSRVDSLKHQRRGSYVGVTFPQKGILYELRVTHKDYPSIKAFDSLPNMPVVEAAKFTIGKAAYPDIENAKELKIKIQDSENKDYYLIDDGQTINSYTEKLLNTFPFNEISAYIFEDGLQNGKDIEYISYKYISMDNILQETLYPSDIQIFTITESGFWYLKSWSEQRDFIMPTLDSPSGAVDFNPGAYVNFFAVSEPNSLYSNVEGGYGVFSGITGVNIKPVYVP